MNVQEHIDGISGEDVAAVERAGLDPKLLAHAASTACSR